MSLNLIEEILYIAEYIIFILNAIFFHLKENTTTFSFKHHVSRGFLDKRQNGLIKDSGQQQVT